MARTTTGERAATIAALARASTTDAIDSGPKDEPGGVHPAYARMLQRAEFCRRAALGTEGYRNAYEDSLPRLGGEGDESYFFRHGMVGSTNVVERMADVLVGFLNEQPVTLEKGADKALVDFIEDVDRAGTAMTLYDQDIDYLASIDGLALGLVEHTIIDTTGEVTEQDEALSGSGPYWLMYKLDDVLKPKFKTINGVRTLVQLTLRETVTVDEGRFGTKTLVKYRVYENQRGVITCEVWTTNADGSKSIERPALVVTNQTDIPCALLPYGRKLGKFEWKPAFLDLAYLDEEYYRLKNSVRNLEITACVPTRFRVGAKPDSKGNYPPMPLGTREVVEIPYAPSGVNVPGKMVGWDGPDVSVIDPAMRSLTEIKSEMTAGGAAFLAPDKRAATTATGSRIDDSSRRASLQRSAAAKKDFHEKMLYFTANFLQVPACKVTVNTNFTGEGINPQYLTVLVTMYLNGAISLQALIFAAKTGKLPDTLDAEDEAANLIADQIEQDKMAQQDALDLANASPKVIAPPLGHAPVPAAFAA